MLCRLSIDSLIEIILMVVFVSLSIYLSLLTKDPVILGAVTATLMISFIVFLTLSLGLYYYYEERGDARNAWWKIKLCEE